MTEDQTTEAPPRTVPAGWRPAAILAAVAALLFLALWIASGLPHELSESDKREIRICELSKAMGGASVTEAEQLCARSWQR